MNQFITITLSVEELTALVESSIKSALANMTTSTPPVKEPEFLDVSGAAALLHLKPATLYSYCHYNKIPYLKRSGKLYFERSVVLAWIREGRHETAKAIQEAI